jgi:hypothetical protein
MNVAFVDIFLDVLIGAPAEMKRVVHDIVSFECVRGISDSDSIVDILERIQDQVANSVNTDFKSILLQEWKRQMVFVLWLELARKTAPTLTNLTVGRISAGVMKERVLYYFRGSYYVKLGINVYDSSDFRAIIGTIFQQGCQL